MRAIGRNKGYPWERECETLLMALEDQDRSTHLTQRTRRQPASGAMESAKGDVVTNLEFLSEFGQLMVECKDRKDARGDGKSVRILKSELDKARREAESDRMVPVFAFKVKQPVGGNRDAEFKGDAINPMNTKWFALPVGDFIRMLEYIRDLRRDVISLRRQLEEAPPVEASSSVYAESDRACRECRRALDKAAESVRRVMGG